MDDGKLRADYVSFARNRGADVLRVAGLLHEDPLAARSAALAALRFGAARAHVLHDDRARDAAVLGRLARTARLSSLVSSLRGQRGGLQVQDHVVHRDDEQDCGEADLGAAWFSLTTDERAAIALYEMTGIGVHDVARMTWRRTASVQRELDRGHAFLAEVAGVSNARLVVARLRRSIRVANPDRTEVTQLVAELLTEPAVWSRSRTAGRGSLITVGTGATVAVLIAASLWFRGSDQAPSAAAPTDAAGPADTVPTVDGLPLPTPSSGLKLVGYEGIMLTVPIWLEGAARSCDDVGENLVVYPDNPDDAPCADLPANLSTLSFGAANRLDLPSLNRNTRELFPDRVVVTSIRRDGRDFVQYAALLDENVAVAVRSPDRHLVHAVISSVQLVPPSFAVMPDVEGLNPVRAMTTLRAVGLSAMQFQDPSPVEGLRLVVANQAPAVGTVLATNEIVSLGVIPR